MTFLQSGIGDGKDLALVSPDSVNDTLYLTIKIKFYFGEQSTDFYDLDVALEEDETLNIQISISGTNIEVSYRDDFFSQKTLEIPILLDETLSAIEVEDNDPFVSTTIGGRILWESFGSMNIPPVTIARRLYVKKTDNVIWKWIPKIHGGYYYFGKDEFYLYADMVTESLSVPTISGDVFQYILEKKPVAGSPIMIGSLIDTIELKRVQTIDEVLDGTPVPYILIPDQPLGKATFILPNNVSYQAMNVFYEQDSSNYFLPEEIELNPVLNTTTRGFIYLSKTTQAPRNILFRANGTFISLGEDVFFTAKVVDILGNPVANEPVEFTIDPSSEMSNMYFFDGVSDYNVTGGDFFVIYTDVNGNVFAKYNYYSINNLSSVSIKARIQNLTEDDNSSSTITLSLNQTGFGYPPERILLAEGNKSGDITEITASFIDSNNIPRENVPIEFFHDAGTWIKPDGTVFNDIAKSGTNVFRQGIIVVTSKLNSEYPMAKIKHKGHGNIVIRARTPYEVGTQRPSYIPYNIPIFIWAHPLELGSL